MNWKWKNVPLPEAHLVGLIIGTILQIFLPIHLFQSLWIGHILGWPVIILGMGLCAWAVIETKEMNIEHPDELLTNGPYAISRNPMYVGWTLIFLGISLIVNSVWMLTLVPAVIFYMHFVDIRQEEQLLEKRFGEEYRHYKTRVRRYL